MSNLSFSTGFRNAILDSGLDTLFDSGFLDIYSGTIPADADATEGAGTLLASIELGATALAAAASGAKAKTGTWSEAAAPVSPSGTAAWARLYDSNHTTGASTTAVRIDMDVTIVAGGGDLEISSLTIANGDSIVVDSFTFSLPLSA